MKTAVVGSINMDMTVTAERIPLKGETLRGEDVHYIPGGKGANQAVAMAKLGAQVEMFGCVGDDDAGAALLENLQNAGVITDHIKVIPDVSTGLALITVGENDNTIIVVAGANNCVDREYVDQILDELRKCDIVLLQHEIPQETIEYVIEKCYESQVKIVLNPGPARPVRKEILDKVTYLTPNEHEAVILFGDEMTTEELLKKYPEKLIITQGSRGVATCLNSGEILVVPARKANVVDTTGAGDTLNGAFTVEIASGSDIKNALQFANTAASLSTEKFGAQGGMPCRSQVLNAMKEMEV
ncbi:ribokinase [Robinsoniella peoriensis]|uniref:ribokinase n=1 Tax=Robinsoniella peoriensis TaxID=180332 RepID=UPI0005C7E241|nr:ribokinase [Robinsoniella peoriensis]